MEISETNEKLDLIIEEVQRMREEGEMDHRGLIHFVKSLKTNLEED